MTLGMPIGGCHIRLRAKFGGVRQRERTASCRSISATQGRVKRQAGAGGKRWSLPRARAFYPLN